MQRVSSLALLALLGFVSVQAVKPVTKVSPSFLALKSQAKSDWDECSFPEEYEKSGQYDFEFKNADGKWMDAAAFLVHCRLSTTPLFLQIVGEPEMQRVNWSVFYFCMFCYFSTCPPF